MYLLKIYTIYYKTGKRVPILWYTRADMLVQYPRTRVKEEYRRTVLTHQIIGKQQTDIV